MGYYVPHMNISAKEHLLHIFSHLMRPIIRIGLRNGLMYGEFVQVCKSLYVEVATEDYGLRGRKTNISRVAVLTGLNRKEVKRVRDELESGERQQGSEGKGHHGLDRITRVLSGWHHDAEFTDAEGQPRPLSVGEGKPATDVSFHKLVKRYGGDVPPVALLTELKRTNTVKEIQPDIFVPLHRYFIPSSNEQYAIDRAAGVISDLADTLHHNLYGRLSLRDKSDRFEMRASNHKVDAKQIKPFKLFLNQTAKEFLERVDAWLSEHESLDDDENQNNVTESVRLGAGVYCIQGNNLERKSA